MEENIEKHINKINQMATADFEGLSPIEMDNLLYNTFEKGSPVQLRKLSDEDYASIPILNQMLYFADIIQKAGEIKLTAKGYLPTKMVADLYYKGFLKDVMIETGINKLYKETDSNVVNLIRLLAELMSLTKKTQRQTQLNQSRRKNNPRQRKVINTYF